MHLVGISNALRTDLSCAVKRVGRTIGSERNCDDQVVAALVLPHMLVFACEEHEHWVRHELAQQSGEVPDVVLLLEAVE